MMNIKNATALIVMLLVGFGVGLLMPHSSSKASATVSTFPQHDNAQPAPFDIIADYQIKAKYHDVMAMCIEAKIIAEKYHAAKDLDSENQWHILAKRDCEKSDNNYFN